MKDYHDIEILLVEDNPNDVEMTLRALKQNNLANRIVVAEDGEEALDFIFARGVYSERYVEEAPKMILLDLKLPKVDGLEVLKAIRNDPRTKAFPVIILTSSQEESDIVESYELGVNSYIVKPVEFDKFTAMVKELGLYWLLLNKVPNR